MKRLAIIIALLSSGRALAGAPWAEGVSAEQQAKANVLLAEGNELFAQREHAGALAKFQDALELWDHPLIRFNLAITLIRLDRIVDAADQLERALRFGEAPFPPGLHHQALDYQKLVLGRIGTIEVRCEQKGATVFLDGKRWFSCPATQQVRVLAGDHVVVGESEGFMTISRRLAVAGGAALREQLRFVTLDAIGTLEYPTRPWIPWVVASAGAVLGAGGVAFYVGARREAEAVEAEFAMRCPRGCTIDLSTVPDLADRRDDARRLGTIGLSMIIGGGVVAVGGVVWGAVLNRPRRVLPSVEVSPSGGATAGVAWSF